MTADTTAFQPTGGLAAPEMPPAEEAPTRSPSPRRRWLPIAALLALVAVGLGLHLWQDAQAHVATDNAAVAGHLHPVSARVAGTVAGVWAEEHQPVKAGQVLFALDDRDARIRLAQAEAAYAQAQRQAAAAELGTDVTARTAAGQAAQATGTVGAAEAGIESARAAVALAAAGVPTAQAQLAQAQATATQAASDERRWRALYGEGGVSAQQMQAAATARRTAEAQVRQAQQAVASAQARLAQAHEAVRQARAQAATARGGLTLATATAMQAQVTARQAEVAKAAVDQAAAALADARQQLSYTRIVAPCDGRLAKRAVEVGQRVQPGQSLMMVVEPTAWVVANFKETQLDGVRAGQPVEITLDAFPRHPFSGRVESFSPAAGSTMALLPPDNATGNFTKVVQRVPVKVRFDPTSLRGYEDRVVPGMSADVRVTVR